MIKRNRLIGLTSNVFPGVSLRKIQIFFIPIKSPETNELI